MSLFGLDWAAGTEVGEVLKAQREAESVERQREAGRKSFYVPADLAAVDPRGGVRKGKAN